MPAHTQEAAQSHLRVQGPRPPGLAQMKLAAHPLPCLCRANRHSGWAANGMQIFNINMRATVILFCPGRQADTGHHVWKI